MASVFWGPGLILCFHKVNSSRNTDCAPWGYVCFTLGVYINNPQCFRVKEWWDIQIYIFPCFLRKFQHEKGNQNCTRTYFHIPFLVFRGLTTLTNCRTRPVFYQWLSKVLANERRCYICNVFSNWPRPCSAIDRKRAQDLSLQSDLVRLVALRTKSQDVMPALRLRRMRARGRADL